MTEEIRENRRKSEENAREDRFNVYFSYSKGNDTDLEHIIEIGRWLMDNGLTPWITEWHAQPGKLEYISTEHQVEKIPSAAVFIGQTGFDQRLLQEVGVFLNEFDAQRPLIPVFLPSAPLGAKFPSIFLKSNTSVDFRKNEPDPLEHLIFGITGKHPTKVYRPGVLVASLGDSPVVVSSMYNMLTARKGLTLDRVMVLRPNNNESKLAYQLINEALPGEVKLDEKILPFSDANSEDTARQFLHMLYQLLVSYQDQGDSVYLSLAGGRKSMAALMAWVVPFFSCIKGLYHVIDKREKLFLSAYQLNDRPRAKHRELMNPSLDDISLVEIPRASGQKISKAFISRLPTLHQEDIGDDPEVAEALVTGQIALQKDEPLEVCVTNLAIKQFDELFKQHKDDARTIRNGLIAMNAITTLQQHTVETELFKAPKMQPAHLHYFTGLPLPICPIFYTRPGDIDGKPDEPVERVVICALERKETTGYKKLKAVTKSADFSIQYTESLKALPVPPSPANSILIVPLGKSPMIATQLYTLLCKEEQHTIHRVILIYPEDEKIVTGAEIIEEAFVEKDIPYKSVRLRGLRDIVSTQDCNTYQKCLEEEIELAQKEEQGKYKIDLALSGGRKGMTAMTIFAAQKRGIRYLYHTLILNAKLDDDIDREMSVEELINTKLSKQELYDRLFLQPMGPYPYKYFTLFKVPVFRSDGW